MIMITEHRRPVSQIPRIWVWLQPILTPAARYALLQIMKGTTAEKIPYLVLGIIRSAIENRSTNLRTKQGLLILIKDELKMKPADLLITLKDTAMLRKTGVISHDQSMVSSLTNYVKWLSQPAGIAPLFNSQIVEPEKKKKPQLSEYEKRRLKAKQDRRDAEDRALQERRRRFAERQREVKPPPVRWLA